MKRINTSPVSWQVLLGLFGALGAASLVHADPATFNARLTIGVDAAGLMGTYKIDGPIARPHGYSDLTPVNTALGVNLAE